MALARCPECAGKTKYNPANRMMVCGSCGLSLTRGELDTYWKKIKSQNFDDQDEFQRKKSRRKEWLDWHTSSKNSKSDD